ncbi:MAG TPA: flavin reductase family protein [Candidatus Eisenbacteria bacterium]|nr:flavin reductase family protein [Candidatus Eisenbacteria bacterium]
MSEAPHPRLQTIDPASTPPADVYALLVGCVVPRPIAFVSSLSEAGVANLAPFSFFNAGGANPPSLVFSTVTSGAGRDKDTLHNVRATGEYVVHISPYGLRERMNQASAEYPPDVDEFEAAGFTKAPSVRVKPWRAAECPIAMECRLHQIIQHGEGPYHSNYVIGEILLFHVAELLLTGLRVDSSSIDAIGRLGGPNYTRVTKESVFSLARPVLPSK